MIGEIEKQNLENLRKIRAYSILAKGDMPKMIGEETFIVPSQSDSEVGNARSQAGINLNLGRNRWMGLIEHPFNLLD